jgi:diketogulonate reductase-like aldo/keto reductase
LLLLWVGFMLSSAGFLPCGITSYRANGRSIFDDPVIAHVAAEHGMTPAQVILRWDLQEGRSAVCDPARIAAGFDVFDFELTADPIAALDRLNMRARGGPEPESVTPERSWSIC